MNSLYLKNDFDNIYQCLTENSIYGTYVDEYSKNQLYKIFDNMFIKDIKPNMVFEIHLLKKTFDFGFLYTPNLFNNITPIFNNKLISKNDEHIINWYLNNRKIYNPSILFIYDIRNKKVDLNFNYYFFNNETHSINFCKELVNVYGLKDMSNIIESQYIKTMPILEPMYIVRQGNRNVDTIRLVYFINNHTDQKNDILEKLKLTGYEYFTEEMLRQIYNILDINAGFEIQVDIDKNGTLGDILSINIFLGIKEKDIILKLAEIFNEYNIFEKLSNDSINKNTCFKKFILDENDMNFKWKYYIIKPYCVKIRWKKGTIYEFKAYLNTTNYL